MTTFKDPTHAPDRKLTLAEILEIFAAGRLPLKFTAYDGSTAGPEDAELGPMRSVVIWCDQFNVAFGTAAIA